MTADLTPVGIAGAYLAGLASFVSPCVFPLVPGYLSYLAGTAGGQVQPVDEQPALRWQVFLHAVFFVLGFSLIFVALGATASELGTYLRAHQVVIRQVSGVFLILAGLQVSGVLRIVPLLRERRLHLDRGEPAYLKSGLVGLAFGAGWTPCVGPFLGSVLTLAATNGSLRAGVLLLLVYSFGLGLPFLLTGLLVDRLTPAFRRVNRSMPIITLVSGALLAAMGVLVLSGTLVRLSQYSPFLGG